VKPSLVIPRLRGEVAAFANRVFGASEFAAMFESTQDLPVPCGFVIPLGKDPGENRTWPDVTQVVDDQVAIVVAVANTLDERGQDSAEAMEEHELAVINALVGWQASAVHGPFRYLGGEHLSIDRARLWHQFAFGARFILNKPRS
jgi:hypothetical protein